jgi:hypothetical protein
MKKIVLFFVLVIFWVVMLFPKIMLWEYFVEEMNKKNISIVAKEVDIKLWLVYNKIDINKMILLKSFKVDSFDVKYSFLNPLYVKLKGNSQYGNFVGEVAILDKKGFILFKKSNLKKAIFKRYFKKQKDGMKYEFTY